MKEIRLRQFIKLGIDSVIVLSSIVAAFLLKYDYNWIDYFRRTYQVTYLIVFLVGYFTLKMQKQTWKRVSVIEIIQILSLNIFTGVVFILGVIFLRSGFPKHIAILTILLCSSLQLLCRYVFKMKLYFEGRSKLSKNKKDSRTLIIGAGAAGEILVRESENNPNFKYNIVGFLDDDHSKKNVKFHGREVIGEIKELDDIVKSYDIDVLLLAIPSATSALLNILNNKAKELGVELMVLPSIDNILENESLTKQVRDVSIEDLLGRDQIEVNERGIEEFIEGKTIFITGGAGSIGSELARQIAKHNPKKLVTIDVNENAIYFLELELRRRYPNLQITSEICNVREIDKLEWLFETYKPSIVFHAAAHKHVPLMEHNPEEAIKNNVFGSKNVMDCADRYGVERFVLVSTDKAVNPTNVMGATKRACEIVLESKAKNSRTKFMAVRFGNVLGSNGSVIPIFKKLIDEGKNLTLTHKDITRYFMTIPEAAQLVIEAGSLGSGGEVFILDMGKPIKIIDLAKKLIELSNADVGIDIVGLRPGEKLYEELLYDVSVATKTENRKIFITKLRDEEVEIDYHIDELKTLINNRDKDGIREQMKLLVSTYREPDHHFEKNEELKPVREEKLTIESFKKK